MATDYDQKQKAIAEQERKGRYVVNGWFTDSTLRKGWDIVQYENLPQNSPVDLHYTLSNSVEINTLSGKRNADVKLDCYIEVKTRYQSAESLTIHPEAILRTDKYDRMKSVAGGSNSALYYAVIVNDSTLYVYDVTDIDAIPHTRRELPLRHIQYSSTSSTSLTDCYLMDYKDAIRTCDISDYIKRYNSIYANDLQAEKETVWQAC